MRRAAEKLSAMLLNLLAVLSILLALASATTRAASPPPSFAIVNDTFRLDGQPILLQSCSFHYSRAPAELWDDRLLRLAAMGCNTIQTYVPWNWHEAEPGQFDFSSKDRNIGGFLAAVRRHGMLTIVRAGPYMCGEWEFGGLPSWLIEMDPTMKVRTWDATWIQRVDLYFTRLMAEIKPFLYSNGNGSGSVILVQVENEYGSYGDVSTNAADKQYLEHLVQLASDHLGNSAVGKFEAVQIYTDDGGNAGFMTRGSLNGSAVFTVGDGGPGPDDTLCSAMATFNPPGMRACIDDEFYAGWITHAGSAIANTSSAAVAKWLDAALSEGHSVSIYMAFGGSNFGPYSGANGGGKSYQSTIQSYDYSSPVAEGGEHGWGPDGDKYAAVQAVFKKHADLTRFPIPPEPPLPPRFAYAPVALDTAAWMLDAASLAVLAPAGARHIETLEAGNMEAFGQRFGFILYSTNLTATATATASAGGGGDAAEKKASKKAVAAVAAEAVLEIKDYPRDRAQIFVDGREACPPIFRNEAAPTNISLASSPSVLRVLVENMGRMTFGSGLWDPKGIQGSILLDGKTLHGFDVHNLGMVYDDTIAKLPFHDLTPAAMAAAVAGKTGPVFLRGVLHIDTAAGVGDTYALLNGPTWRRGWLWINGFHLGRYWADAGPQLTMFVPSSLLHAGDNDIVLLELQPDKALDIAARRGGGGGESEAAATAAATSPLLHFVDAADFTGSPSVCSRDVAPSAASTVVALTCGAGGALQSWRLPAAGSSSAITLDVPTSTSPALCLSASSPSKVAANATAAVVPCDASDPTQRFDMNATSGGGGGVGTVIAKASGLVLQVQAAGSDGAAAVLFSALPADGSAAAAAGRARWSEEETPLHVKELVVQDGGRCLSVCPRPQRAAW